MEAKNPQPTSSSHPQTFWTCCSRCKTKYEYAKTFLNQNLLCPTCQQPFLATQIQAPYSQSSGSASVGDSSSSRSLNKRRRTDVKNPSDVGEVSQGTSMSNSAGLKRSSVKESSHLVRAMLMRKGNMETVRCLKFREDSQKNKVEADLNSRNWL